MFTEYGVRRGRFECVAARICLQSRQKLHAPLAKQIRCTLSQAQTWLIIWSKEINVKTLANTERECGGSSLCSGNESVPLWASSSASELKLGTLSSVRDKDLAPTGFYEDSRRLFCFMGYDSQAISIVLIQYELLEDDPCSLSRGS